VQQIIKDIWEPKPQAEQNAHPLQIRASRFVVECLAKGIEVVMDSSYPRTVVASRRSLQTLLGNAGASQQLSLRTELLLSFVSNATNLLRLQLLSLGPDHIDVARTRQDISMGVSHVLSNEMDTRALQDYAAYCEAQTRTGPDAVPTNSENGADWMWELACMKGFRGASIFEHKQKQEYKRVHALFKS
jgi:hypothetical protein